MAFDHPSLDHVLVGSRVHELPGRIGDGACRRTARLPAEPIHELELEGLDLRAGIAGRETRQGVVEQLAPGPGREAKTVVEVR